MFSLPFMQCLLNALHYHNYFFSVQKTSKLASLNTLIDDRFVIGKNARGLFPESVSTEVAISN